MKQPVENGIPLCRTSVHDDDDELETIVCAYTQGEGVLGIFQEEAEPLMDKEGLLKPPKYPQATLNRGNLTKGSK